jgi:SAM-dependent methyltransferase
MPLANSLLSTPDEAYQTYPLDLIKCSDCTLVQLKETVPPEKMFVDYNYLTSTSFPMVAHAKKLAEKVMDIRESHNLKINHLVVEIGSNDGYLLEQYVPYGIPVLGIDPSVKAANVAARKRVPTIQDFFSLRMAESMGRIADVVHANNILAHVPDLNDFVAGVAKILKMNGLFIVEVPDVKALLEKAAFDTIYHEHVYYFSFQSLVLLMARHGLTIQEVERISTHGGSLRLFIKHGNDRPSRWYEVEDWHQFSGSVLYGVRETCRFIEAALREKKSVAGFGAAAKATIFLNYAHLTGKDLLYVADDTPCKQGKFIPGTGLQIVPTVRWLSDNPEETLILCWNFAQEIAHKYRLSYLANGGKFSTWMVRPHE